LRLFKIKAQIYPDNFRVKNLLKDAGFNYESTLINETLRAGKLQNIEVYSLYKTYYEMR
jgi:RimJ/RimL family protein N-acetyltransferase